MKKLIATIVLLLFFNLSLAYGENNLQIIDEALLHLDKPYVYATAGPNSFDCSGFIYYCYKTINNIKLKRSAYDQGYDLKYLQILHISQLLPGDIVFFNTNRNDNDLSDHSGLYMGQGYFIHCSSGKGKVVISTLLTGYYNERFSWGRRIYPPFENE